MRWPWKRRKCSNEAQEATERAQQDLDDIRRRAPEIESTARYLKSEATRNHFSERMTQAFRGYRGTGA